MVSNKAFHVIDAPGDGSSLRSKDGSTFCSVLVSGALELDGCGCGAGDGGGGT